MINVNNVNYVGKSIIITDNKVIIDGNDVTPDSKKIEIVVNGDIDNLKVDYCENINVNGNVNTLSTSSGNVNCADVNESVSTSSGDVVCGNIGGNVRTSSGDVDCGNVQGMVNTISGDIKMKK